VVGWGHVGGGKGEGMKCADGRWYYWFPFEEGEDVPVSSPKMGISRDMCDIANDHLGWVEVVEGML